MSPQLLRKIGWFILCATAGALASGQAPLYYSNQHQYFLHGLADAGEGHLHEDWLANTTDPTPLFSLLVSATVRLADPALFHVLYALIIGLYFVSLVELALQLAGGRAWWLRFFVLAVLLFLHSALVRWTSYRLLGHDYPWYLQAGVAGQYVLGPVFQPSTFGVLLVASLWLFLADRPLAAAASAAVGAAMHSTYILHAAFIVLGFVVVLWRDGRRRDVFKMAALGAGALIPTAGFMLWTFRPSSPEMFAEAQQVLAHFRIPHHCLPELWCDRVAVGQIALILLGVLLFHGTRLFVALLIALVISTVLTLLQLLTSSDTLALLFPWRMSALLMPAALAAVIGRLAGKADRLRTRITETQSPFSARAHFAFSLALIVVLAAAGCTIMAKREAYQSSPEEEGLLHFVQMNAQPGDVYLLPIQVPNLKATTRGSLSSDFKPAAAKQRDDRLIPIDLQRFRLATGAPLYVDFKSIPYEDTDVLEWRRRVHWTEELFKRLRKGDAVQAELHKSGITHIIVRAQDRVPVQGMAEVYRDTMYRLLRVE